MGRTQSGKWKERSAHGEMDTEDTESRTRRTPRKCRELQSTTVKDRAIYYVLRNGGVGNGSERTGAAEQWNREPQTFL